MTRSSSSLRLLVVLGALSPPLVSAACSGGTDVATTADGSAPVGPPPASSDPVLLGRWELLFAGLPFDAPNADP